MLKVGDIVTITWGEESDKPIGIIILQNGQEKFFNYYVKWFESEQQDGEYLPSSLKKVD